jgi:MoxR-like ATPase
MRFKREYRLPHMLVFADRNQVEKEETFEIPSAARDRFMMEIPISVPQDPALRKSLVFNSRFHDTDSLTNQVEENLLQFDKLNDFSKSLQLHIQASPVLEDYAMELWQATVTPAKYGIKIDGVDIHRLIHAGASPRGMAMLLKAAKVNAWLSGRESVLPADIHTVFHEVLAHRLVLSAMYESRRTVLSRQLMTAIIRTVAVP